MGLLWSGDFGPYYPTLVPYHSVTKSTFKNGPYPNKDFLDSVFHADFKNHNENFWGQPIFGKWALKFIITLFVVHNFISAF